MHRTYIADIERGVRNVTLRSIRQLSAALQVPVETLFARANQLASAPAGGAKSGAREILLIEDSAPDVEIALEVLERMDLINPVKVLTSGEQALDYLCGGSTNGTAPSPQLILLDLHLTKIEGIEVLRKIKSDPRTKDLPVVVLTASRHDRDILECSRLGVEHYVVKPLSLDGLSRATSRLSLRWALLPAPRSRIPREHT